MAPRANFDLETLRDAIPNIFDQVQSSTATHKKNCVTLFKLHGAAAAIVDTTQQGKKQAELKLTGEKEFTDTVMDMINRVLVVKKGVPSADRITKFVGSYAKFLNDKDSSNEGIPSVANSEDETVISRFITRLLKHLMKGFTAKNKNVRFRVVSLTAEIVSYLGELDEDLYKTLRSGLLDRLQDKESLVRTHAVVTLCKLAMSDDPEDLDEDEQPILVCLLDSLCCDPAPEVRRASLIHIPLVPQILLALLTRTRDVDPVTRKLVYTSLLPRLDHPKQLTITQREFIVCHGLGDREEAVRVAAAKVLKGWLDLYEGDIVEFLSIFDALNGEVAVDAVKSIFVSAPEVLDGIEFDDAFWTNLKPETAMLARVFVEHCFSKQDEARLESSLPVVTALAFHVQSKYNSLLELLQEADEAGVLETEDDEESEARDEQIANIEFVIGELLKLAVHLDFGDEIGRRKMFTITREMIAHAALPDSLIKPCLGVLEVLSANERDLIRLVVEVVNELRDTEDADPEGNDNQTAEGSQAESPTRRQKAHTKDLDNMTPAERMQADVVNLRCLNLCIGVLEKVNGSFDENSTLEGILADLVIPSVKRKELVLREKGLACLGLCCLIARNMALNSFQLFLSQIKSAPEGLKIQVLRVVFDVLMTYEKDFLGRPDEIGDRVIGFLMQVLETEESHAVQALLCLGLSKLMLFGLVTDNRVLTGLVLAYVSPVTADNHQLRQCLAYFLPAYCYSSSTNQKRMQSVFTTAFDLVNQVYESLEDDQSMVTPLHFGQLFVDWTNTENLAHLPGGSDQDSDVHVALAVDILQGLYESDCPPETKKVLCQLLNKLSLPEEVENHLLYTFDILLLNLQEQCPFEDPATDKIFMRFKARATRHFSPLLKDFDERACFHDESFNKLFEFIGVTAPRQHHQPKKESGSEEDDDDDKPTRKAKEAPKPKAKSTQKKPVSDSDEDDEEAPASEQESDDDLPVSSQARSPTPPPPKRGQVKGKAKENAANEQPVASSSAAKSRDESRENVPEPKTPNRRKAAKRVRSPSQPTIPSPAHKRQQRAANSKTRASKSKPVADVQPLSNATNARDIGRPKRGGKPSIAPPPKPSADLPSRRPAPPPGGSDEDAGESDSDESDEPIPTMEEKIGWGDSDDM